MAHEMHTNVATVWKRISDIFVKDDSAWKRVHTVWVKISGVWRKTYFFIYPLASGVSGQSDLKVVTAGNPQTATARCEAFPSGGLPPYTYQWTANKVSGQTLTIPSLINKEITLSITTDQNLEGVYDCFCTVTDSDSPPSQVVTATQRVTASCERLDL